MSSDTEQKGQQTGQPVLIERGIYKYSKDFPKELGYGIPNHYHLCVKIDNTVALLSCGTTQHGNVESRTLYFGWKYVDIEATATNGFKEKTHVPCDSFFEISQAEFDRLFQGGMITKTGMLTAEEYQTVLDGIRQSKRMPKAEKNRILGTDLP